MRISGFVKLCFGFAPLLISISTCAVPNLPPRAESPAPTLAPALIAQGRAIYDAECAACHGARGEGAANWKIPADDGSFLPPPHDSSGHTWHHPDFLLLDIIANGGQAPNSKMPAFRDKLSPTEMRAALEFIKTFWNDEARQIQWTVTLNFPAPTP